MEHRRKDDAVDSTFKQFDDGHLCGCLTTHIVPVLDIGDQQVFADAPHRVLGSLYQPECIGGRRDLIRHESDRI